MHTRSEGSKHKEFCKISEILAVRKTAGEIAILQGSIKKNLEPTKRSGQKHHNGTLKEDKDVVVEFKFLMIVI